MARPREGKPLAVPHLTELISRAKSKGIDVQDLSDDFFAFFVEVRKGREGPSIEVETGITSADPEDNFHSA